MTADHPDPRSWLHHPDARDRHPSDAITGRSASLIARRAVGSATTRMVLHPRDVGTLIGMTALAAA